MPEHTVRLEPVPHGVQFEQPTEQQRGLLLYGQLAVSGQVEQQPERTVIPRRRSAGEEQHVHQHDTIGDGKTVSRPPDAVRVVELDRAELTNQRFLQQPRKGDVATRRDGLERVDLFVGDLKQDVAKSTGDVLALGAVEVGGHVE